MVAESSRNRAAFCFCTPTRRRPTDPTLRWRSIEVRISAAPKSSRIVFVGLHPMPTDAPSNRRDDSTIRLADEAAVALWQSFCSDGEPTSTDAFDTIYKAYHGDVFRYCRALLRDETRATDVTHEVFLDLLSKDRKPEIRSSVKGYLLRAAYNICKTALAKPRLAQVPEQPADDPPDADMQRHERFDALDECLSRLTAKDQSLVALHHGDGLTYHEIRDVLGLRSALSTLGRRISRALRSLRACLQAKGIF